eukprot:COSAG02_NODE_1030_length_15077_cov_36.210119_13_plen_580_part_00
MVTVTKGAAMQLLLLLLLLLLLHIVLIASTVTGATTLSKPNLIYILLDDLDVLLGSEVVLKQTHALISEKGARFTHFRTHSPKCTPSRTGQLAGRYYQNVRVSGDPTGTVKGRGLDQMSLFDESALFPQLHAAGYLTSVVGKLHNGQKEYFCQTGPHGNNTAPFSHVSTQCSPCGGYWKGEYIHKGIDDPTTQYDNSVDLNAFSGYSHGQFGNRSAEFVRQAVARGRPFFAYIGTTGPHLPCIPAPWHMSTVASWSNVTAPRLPTFNFHAVSHHPTIAALPDLTRAGEQIVDQQMRDRWGTLLSVDDLVAGVVHNLEELNVLERTYILFSSDHGYHLGNYRLPMEKMWPYETDVRIPFYISGPGIASGQTPDVMAVNIDIAPTLLDLAGIRKPNQMDGRSLLPLITGSPASKAKAAASWRTHTIIAFAEGQFQYWDGPHFPAPGRTVPNGSQCCTEDVHDCCAPVGTAACTASTGGCVTGLSSACFGGSCTNYTFDVPSNQWRMLRIKNSTDDVSYIQWDPLFKFDVIAFHAYFDLELDPLQQKNVWPSLPVIKQEALQAEMTALFRCHGTAVEPSTCP